MHTFDAEQAERYFAMARDDIQGIATGGRDPAEKGALTAALRAWDQASWAWLAWKRKTDFWDLQKSMKQAEKDREIAAALQMPQLDHALVTAQEALRGWANGPSWVYDDGSHEVDRAVFEACVGTLKDAFSRMEALMVPDRTSHR